MAGGESVWFFVVDSGRGRLLRGTRTPAGRIHVDELDSIENHTEEHEHGRPSPRAGKQGNTYASAGHEDDHQLHRFAKAIVGWIGASLDTQGVERATLFSAPRFLGELRKLYGPGLADKLDEHQADLTQLSPGHLASHPAVERLVSDGLE